MMTPVVWIGWTLIGACSQSVSNQFKDPPCDPRALDETEVRVRRLVCGDEEIVDGHGGRGDWILENNRLRLSLRDVGSSLSRLEGTGGGLLDIALVDRENAPTTLGDGLLEALPMVDDQIASVRYIEEFTDEIRTGVVLTLDEGISIHIWLEPNSPVLFVDSSDWSWRPKPEAEIYGAQIHPNRDLPLWSGILQWNADRIQSIDGDIVLTGLSSIEVASADDAWTSSSITVDGSILGQHVEWIDAFDGSGDWIGRSWISDTVVSLPMDTTSVQFGAPGCVSSPQGTVEDSVADLNLADLSVGTCGSIRIRVHQNGIEQHGLLQLPNKSIFLSKNGQRIPLIEHTEPSILWGAMTQEPQILQPLSTAFLTTHPTLDIELSTAFEHANLDTLHIQTLSNNHSWTHSWNQSFWESIALGATHVLMVGNDSIPILDTNIPLQSPIPLDDMQLGLLSDDAVLSWPWTPRRTRAFGALESDKMPPEDLLFQATAQGRFSAVDHDLYTDLRDTLWDDPDFIWLPSPTIDTLRAQCDFRQSLPLGPWTWFDNDLIESTPERALRERAYSTGNGPKLSLSHPMDTPRQTILTLSIDHAEWMGLEQWELWSEAGLEAQGDIDAEPIRLNTLVPNRDHYCLIAWGNPEVHPFGDDLSWGIRVY